MSDHVIWILFEGLLEVFDSDREPVYGSLQYGIAALEVERIGVECPGGRLDQGPRHCVRGDGKYGHDGAGECS